MIEPIEVMCPSCPLLNAEGTVVRHIGAGYTTVRVRCPGCGFDVMVTDKTRRPTEPAIMIVGRAETALRTLARHFDQRYTDPW